MKYHNLCDLAVVTPSIVLDMRYATSNNFTGQPIYPSAHCFVHKNVARALQEVQQELQAIGLGLKIWDGYRPLSAQKILWNLVPDPRYVADPAQGSRHNNGCAVDCTLVDVHGKELAMPTEFDDFSEQAHRNFSDLPEHIIKNRQLLEAVMHKHGFVGLPTEWWHFDYHDWQQYPLLDIPFEQLPHY